MTVYEIPLIPSPQRVRVPLNNVIYTLTFIFRQTSDGDGGWIMDVGDANNTPLACGIPLVTGTDLLGQFRYVGMGGGMAIGSDGNADAIPGFTDLGVTSHLYFVPNGS